MKVMSSTGGEGEKEIEMTIGLEMVEEERKGFVEKKEMGETKGEEEGEMVIEEGNLGKMDDEGVP